MVRANKRRASPACQSQMLLCNSVVQCHHPTSNSAFGDTFTTPSDHRVNVRVCRQGRRAHRKVLLPRRQTARTLSVTLRSSRARRRGLKQKLVTAAPSARG